MRVEVMPILPKSLLSKNSYLNSLFSCRAHLSSGFTLIELLIVVAIIGILASVGIPMYNGYMTSAKISVAQQNHNNIRNDITLKLHKCASEGGQIKLLRAVSQYEYSSCNKSPGVWAGFLGRHIFLSYEYWNPYFKNAIFIKRKSSKNPKLGMMYIWHTNDSITLITNIGDDDGNNKYIFDSIFVE